MVLSQELFSLPTKMSFPPKPKKSQDLAPKEFKTMPKKPEMRPEQISCWNFDLNTNMEESFQLDTVDFVFPMDAEVSLEEQDTEPLLPQEDFADVWSLDDCISPAKAEGKEEIIELMVPTTNVGIEGDSFSFLFGQHGQDILKETMKESGLDFDSILDINMAPVLPQPIPSTKGFITTELIQPIVEQESRQLNTINLDDLGYVPEPISPPVLADLGYVPEATSSPDFGYAPQPSVSTGLVPSCFIPTSITASVSKEDTDDPDWCPENVASTSRAPVYARKSIIHKVQKPVIMKKRPGRPERQAPYDITDVPSRKKMSSSFMSQEVIEGLKYRRMRDLNNKASKDCRARRRNKQQDMEMEQEELEEKNRELKKRVAYMEGQVAYYKSATNRL